MTFSLFAKQHAGLNGFPSNVEFMKHLLVIALLSLALPSQAGFRSDPYPRAITSPGGHYVFTMIPGPKGAERKEAFGICYAIEKDGSFKEQWRTSGWFSQDILLHYDGEILVRTGSWRSGDQDAGDPVDSLAVAFYKKGKLLKHYKISELVMDKTKLQYTEAGLWWLKHELYKSPDFRPGEPLFQLKTLDGILYTFAIDTGEISSSK